MPVIDRREPAVYVTIEDASYAAPALEVGRVGYIATVCDRGPHNRVFTLTTREDFHRLFGKPNFRTTAQAHYLADKFLQYSNKLLLVRVMPTDSTLSNVKIMESPYYKNIEKTGTSEPAHFNFHSREEGAIDVRLSNHTYSSGDYVVGTMLSGWKFKYDNDNTPIIPVGTTGDHEPEWNISYVGAYTYDGTVRWVCEENTQYNTVTCGDEESYASVSVGDWIFCQETAIDEDDLNYAAQVISKTYNDFVLTLDRDYRGGVYGTNKLAATREQYRELPVAGKKTLADFTDDGTLVYWFYAKGTGTYYNNIIVKGVRNTNMEKMYTDSYGVPLYPYLFMDLGVYITNEDGSETLLEGPWTVSLIRRTYDNVIIRDLTTGNGLFIEDVINENSNYVSVFSGSTALDKLAKGAGGGTVPATDKEDAAARRLVVTTLLSTTGAYISQYGNVGRGGANLYEGTNGNAESGVPLYDTYGNLVDLHDTTQAGDIIGLLTQAYQGALTSVDGSIEQIPECVYPWYDIDYILTGGYHPAIQEGGRYLADYRQDCIHLGDTGANVSSYTADITARLNDVPWNVWTSALYVQYRKIFDIFTGEYFWVNPVYHAIERHLYCDGQYFLAEPVAGIEKGAIQERIELAYRANHTERGDLQDKQLNMVIVEPQGKYILTQLTSWKRLSVLQRLHVAKFVAYLRKTIPILLKDILQRRATQYWIGQAQYRVSNFLTNFLESTIERYSVLKSFNVTVSFDDVRSELNVYIDITPIRAIERINVFIIVH